MSNTKHTTMIERNLSDEPGVSPWFVVYEESVNKWIVARNHDDPSTDFETGELLWGMRSEIDSEHNTEESARKRLNEIRWD